MGRSPYHTWGMIDRTRTGTEPKATARTAEERQKREGKRVVGADATGKPPDLCVGEDARRRYLGVLAAEKLAQQQRVPR
jgi:hypothetical protein